MGQNNNTSAPAPAPSVVTMVDKNCTATFDTATGELVIRVKNARIDTGGHVAHKYFIRANGNFSLPSAEGLSCSFRLQRPLATPDEIAEGAAKAAKRAARG